MSQFEKKKMEKDSMKESISREQPQNENVVMG